jgi:hypothetical protein
VEHENDHINARGRGDGREHRASTRRRHRARSFETIQVNAPEPSGLLVLLSAFGLLLWIYQTQKKSPAGPGLVIKQSPR